MKSSSKYNNFSEYQKAIQFLEKGCKCGCSAQVSSEKFAQLRENFQNLPKVAQDSYVMANLISMDEGEITTSSRFPKRERKNKRIFYRWNNRTPICQETYFNMLGISLKYLENVKDHLLSKDLITRTHGNTGRMPQWKTKMTIDQFVKEEVKNFLENYAEKCGSPDPSQRYAKKIAVELRASGEVILLPTHMNYKLVHHDFIISIGEDSKLKSLKYESFRKL
jgi:hypothetical protein